MFRIKYLFTLDKSEIAVINKSDKVKSGRKPPQKTCLFINNIRLVISLNSGDTTIFLNKTFNFVV